MISELKNYKHRLEEELEERLDAPLCFNNMEFIDKAAKHFCHLDELSEKLCLSSDDATDWVNDMVNEDGTSGPHWSIAETSAIPRPNGISESSWNVTMNMMYSDYFKVAEKFNVNNPEFFACLAKAFLEDKDAGSGETKLARYYYGIVE